MYGADAMFRGRFEHNLDEKGRVAIPARFRDLILGDQDRASIVITNTDKCLAAYCLKDWELLEKKIATLSQFDPKVSAFKRVIIGCAQECEFDRAGRILIPADLRRDAGIERECVVVGQINKFEIWSDVAWKKMIAESSDQFSLIAQNLFQAGIEI